MRRIVDLLVTSTILYNSAAPAPVSTTTPNCTLEGSLSFFYSGERYELVGWGLVGDAGELLPYTRRYRSFHERQPNRRWGSITGGGVVVAHWTRSVPYFGTWIDR